MLLLIALTGTFVLLLPTASEGACVKDSLACDDGQCVRREDWCDGLETCNDGSDEAYCGERNWWGISPNKCNKAIHFKCEDGLCWPASARCDGTADCRDDSDEDGCDTDKKNSDKSDERIKESDENIIKSDEKTKESDEKIKESDEKIGRSDEKTERSDEKTERSDEKIEESDEKIEESDEKIEESDEKIEESDEKIEESDEIKEKSETQSEEISKENDSEKATSTIGTPSTTISFDFEESRYNGLEDFYETTTEKHSFPTRPYNPPVMEIDYYAKKIELNGLKHPYSTTQATIYRPLPLAHSTPSRKPAVPYTGPTRRYTPRPYRYISAQTPHVGRYAQPHHPDPADNNYISSRHSPHRNGGHQLPGFYNRAPSRFYFKKNYNDIYGRENHAAVKKGMEWISSIRNATGGWGKETPRAIVALSLANNSVLLENDFMQKYFQVHLGMNLLRNKALSLNRLAMFINALIATCQDPRDFQGWDLTELIRSTMRKLYLAHKPPVINPAVYLSLCLADRNLTSYEVHHIMTYLVASRNDEVTRDMTSLALEALACHMQKEQYNAAHFYSLQKMVWNATSKILRRRKEDGSFGSVYSTALAAQALMSVNETLEWDPEPTFQFLKSQQTRNGSFGDFLATYYALPALNGRSLVHLRNTACNPPRVDRELTPQEILQRSGPKSYIRYSLHMGSPLATGYTAQLLVPNAISFFDIMRVAAFENDRFKFSYEEVNGKLNVYSLSDIPNDPEVGLTWRLYIRSLSDNHNIPNLHQLYTGDIRELLPTPDQHVIFWYHPLRV